MNKLFISFTLAFFLCSILTSIYIGGSMASTKADNAITSTDTTISAKSTNGFNEFGVLYIGNEQIKYLDKDEDSFNSCTRGYNGTVATYHNSSSYIYTESSSVFNAAAGFNVATTGTTSGDFNIVTFMWNLPTKTLPALVNWDLPFLEDNVAQYLQIVMILISTGFVISVIALILSVLGGVMQSVFLR